jgi:hypothetical protein
MIVFLIHISGAKAGALGRGSSFIAPFEMGYWSPSKQSAGLLTLASLRPLHARISVYQNTIIFCLHPGRGTEQYRLVATLNCFVCVLCTHFNYYYSMQILVKHLNKQSHQSALIMFLSAYIPSSFTNDLLKQDISHEPR